MEIPFGKSSVSPLGIESLEGLKGMRALVIANLDVDKTPPAYRGN
jgi:hypothetical protein